MQLHRPLLFQCVHCLPSHAQTASPSVRWDRSWFYIAFLLAHTTPQLSDADAPFVSLFSHWASQNVCSPTQANNSNNNDEQLFRYFRVQQFASAETVPLSIYFHLQFTFNCWERTLAPFCVWLCCGMCVSALVGLRSFCSPPPILSLSLLCLCGGRWQHN